MKTNRQPENHKINRAGCLST